MLVPSKLYPREIQRGECPYCGDIRTRVVDVVARNDNQYEEEIHCGSCGRDFALIYSVTAATLCNDDEKKEMYIVGHEIEDNDDHIICMAARPHKDGLDIMFHRHETHDDELGSAANVSINYEDDCVSLAAYPDRKSEQPDVITFNHAEWLKDPLAVHPYTAVVYTPNNYAVNTQSYATYEEAKENDLFVPAGHRCEIMDCRTGQIITGDLAKALAEDVAAGQETVPRPPRVQPWVVLLNRSSETDGAYIHRDRDDALEQIREVLKEDLEHLMRSPGERVVAGEIAAHLLRNQVESALARHDAATGQKFRIKLIPAIWPAADQNE